MEEQGPDLEVVVQRLSQLQSTTSQVGLQGVIRFVAEKQTHPS